MSPNSLSQDHREVLQLLFKSKRDQLHPSHFHALLLHVAARNGQVETVKSLCQLRCDVNEIADESKIEGRKVREGWCFWVTENCLSTKVKYSSVVSCTLVLRT